MKKRPHKRTQFEEQLLAFLERRKGESIDDELLGTFASYLWRKRTEFELTIMRGMVDQ